MRVVDLGLVPIGRLCRPGVEGGDASPCRVVAFVDD
jgi:hypothetical protein